MNTRRIDVVMVERGLARSRAVASQHIRDGQVRVGDRVVTKPSERVAPALPIRVDASEAYVGRGAHKLLSALTAFDIDVSGRRTLDVGASTGGFTQVLLERGARSVVALDVGHGQLAGALRRNERVLPLEGFNARALSPDALREYGRWDGPFDIVVGDLSFISLTHVLGPIRTVITDEADVILLIKPQFEVGRGIARAGVVRDSAARARAIEDVLAEVSYTGMAVRGLVRAAVAGTHGNQEYLIHIHPTAGTDPTEWTEYARKLAGGEG